MKLIEIPDVYIVMLGLHEALRTLGFPAEHIFVSQQDEKILVLVQEDGKYAAFGCGKAITGWENVWRSIATHWNTTTEDDRNEMYTLFRANTNLTRLVMALHARGMFPRKTTSE